ncbi:MAG: polysaccharide deacetylase family protein [Phycisphaerales bacterium]|nr:polysaccharide deacetylase family protein [Phycisphaerales bacterium]
MIHTLQNLVRSTDARMAQFYLSLRQERDGLLIFLFHCIFRDEAEINRNLLDPLDRITVDHLRKLIEYYLEHGYTFVGPDHLLHGLPRKGKFAMLTFDDGYYNNTLALPLLEQYKVPAIFFIATNYILQQKSYWWDALWRVRKAQGASDKLINRDTLSYKDRRNSEIEQSLIERFGADVLKPHGDIDRPMNADELRDFANQPYVYLGNHTADHAILTNYAQREVRREVENCQRVLTEITSQTPTAIAYCNGNFNKDVIATCRAAGLKLGFTIRPRKNVLPLTADNGDLMRLNRFVPHTESPIAQQCRTYRSDIQFYSPLRAAYLKLARGQNA